MNRCLLTLVFTALLGRPSYGEDASSTVPAICGTPGALAQVQGAIPGHSQITGRPELSHSSLSPSGRFLVHYDVDGRNAVSGTDEDANSIPDYVDATIEAFEFSRSLIVDELGYRAPPNDGDSVYDVYIRNLAPEGVYGLTWGIDGTKVTASTIEIDNNYTDVIYATRGLDGLRVTVAHEFYHAVQFGYNSSRSGSWWQELTAVWMEDVAYDDVNDYYQYLPFFLGFPTLSLDDTSPFPASGLHLFGGAIFAHHLETVYGAASVRRTWEVLLDRAVEVEIGDLDAGMPGQGFADVYPRFAVWNYLTGERNRAGYYHEGASYPTVEVGSEVGPGQVFASKRGVINHLASDYIRVDPTEIVAGLEVGFRFDSRAEWVLLVLLSDPSGVSLLWPSSTTVQIANPSQYDEIVLMPIVTSLEGDGFWYEYDLSAVGPTPNSSLVGDFDSDGRVNFNDFLTLVGVFGRKPAGLETHLRTDIDGNGTVNFEDFLKFVRYFGTSI